MPRNYDKLNLFKVNTGADSPEANPGDSEVDIDILRQMPHELSDQQVFQYLEWRSQHKGSYAYFTAAERSRDDIEDLRLEAVAESYQNLVNFIVENGDLLLKVYDGKKNKPTLPLSRRRELKKAQTTYRRRLSWQAELFSLALAARDLPLPERMDQEFGLSGFNLECGDSIYDLSEKHYLDSDVISPVLIQGSFIAYRNKYFLNTETMLLPTNYRLYLNPRLSQATEVAQTLVDLAQEQQLPLQFKFLNRPRSLLRARARKGHDFNRLRIDGMVIYGNQLHMSGLLKLVNDCYEAQQEAFDNRLAPILTTPFRPGIGVAAEDGIVSGQESFHGHRARILDKTYRRLENSQNGRTAELPSSEDVQRFRLLLEEQLVAAGINPRNISFPL